MESQSLSKTQPINLALYYKSIDDSIFQEARFIELMNFLIKDTNLINYNYAFYTDGYLLRANLFIPSFHTMYLACGNKDVVIQDKEDLWLIETFSNNRFYMVENKDGDTFDFSNFNIQIIPNIKSLL